MEDENRASLRAFALKALAAEKYPHDRHPCWLSACPACGPVPLVVTLEAHSGSTPGNFRGIVSGDCSRCGAEIDILRFTGPQRTPQEPARLRCLCGQSDWWVMSCERMEGEQGLAGFFDEGVVAGRCAACGRERVIVAYD